jgi:predicted metalloprotease with PDZ domain
MKTLFFTFLILYAQFGFAQHNLYYKIKIDTVNTPQIIVNLRFTAPKTTASTLTLPSSFGSQEKLYNAIKSIKSIKPSSLVINKEKEGIIEINHKPSEEIEIEYTLVQDWKGDLIYPKNYRAVIQKSFIHLTSNALYIFPEHLKKEKIRVTLDWQGLPQNWSLANSLACQQRISTHVLSAENFLNTLYVAGDFRIHKALVKNKPVFLAIRGNKWLFKDQELLATLQNVIEAERNFWKDHKEPHYLVTLMPFVGEGSFNGSALHQSFLLAMTQEFPNDIYIKSLLTHEYCHRWLGVEGIKIKSNNQENAWLTEGFTDYYTYKILWRNNLISKQEYIEKVNEFIVDYSLSPVINAHKDTLGNNFWKGRDYQIFPYKKGFVYALYLEQLIQKKTHYKYSLDDVMFTLLKKSDKKDMIEEKDFIEVVSKLIKQDITPIHNEWIVKGATIPIESESIEGVKDGIKEIGLFEAGFDVEKSIQSYTITDVKEGSEAWKTGLRNGQKVKGLSVEYGKIHIPVKISIEDADKNIKNLEYYPISSEKKKIRQFIP